MKQSKPIPAETLEHCARALKVLAHPARLAIADLLNHERLTVTEIAQRLDLQQAEVSLHLTRMRDNGLLEVEREGRAAYYQICNPACTTVLQCIRKHFI